MCIGVTAPPLVAAATDTRDEPQDTRVEREILRSAGLREGDYDPAVVHQFLILAYRYAADALAYAEHAGSASLEADDVRLAVHSNAMFSAQPPTREHKQELCEEIGEATNVQEQAAQLENELFIKEREALDVLKELESEKKVIADLKLKIQKETVSSPTAAKSDEETDEEQQPENTNMGVDVGGNLQRPYVLMEFQELKENLNRTTGDLAAIRGAVELLRNNIMKEKILLERGRENLSSNSALVSSLEDELEQTSQELQTLKDLQTRREDPSDIFVEIKKMKTEIRQLRDRANASKFEAVMLTAEIEQAKASISTAQVRCITAKKMEEAARAAEALSLAEIKALLSSESSSEGNTVSDGVTLSLEEYSMLYSKAREADENSKNNIEDAMLQVDVANSSESSVKMLEDAKLEVQQCKEALQEALERVEAANCGKITIEEILCRWRSENGHKRHFVVVIIVLFCVAAVELLNLM